MRLKSPICKNQRTDSRSLNRSQRMRPQTKININRKETRIFGAVYERVYDEISEILRNSDFFWWIFLFQSLQSVKNIGFWEFSENSLRSQKFKNQEAWKVKAGNNSISNHFWFLSFYFFLCWLCKFNEFPDQSDFTFRQASRRPSPFEITVYFYNSLI